MIFFSYSHVFVVGLGQAAALGAVGLALAGAAFRLLRRGGRFGLVVGLRLGGEKVLDRLLAFDRF